MKAYCPVLRRNALHRQWGLTLVVGAARSLPSARPQHSGGPDAYVSITVDNGDEAEDEAFEVVTTHVARNSFDPVWDYSCTMVAPWTLAYVRMYGSVMALSEQYSEGDVLLGTFDINVPLTEHGFEQRVRLKSDLSSTAKPAFLVLTVRAKTLYGTWSPALACILLFLVCLGGLGMASKRKALLPLVGGVDQQAAAHSDAIPKQQVETQPCSSGVGVAVSQAYNVGDGAGEPRDFGLAPPQHAPTSHASGAGGPQDFGLAPPQDVRTSHANFGWGGGGGTWGGSGDGGGGEGTLGGCGGGCCGGAGAPLLHPIYYDSNNHFSSPQPVVVSVELTTTTTSRTPMPVDMSVDGRLVTPLTPQPLWPKH